MSVFRTEREAIAEALEPLKATGLNVYDNVPGRAVPPLALVKPASPYLEAQDGDPFGTLRVLFEVWITARAATNDQAQDELEAHLEAALEALVAAGFEPLRVDEPFMSDFNGTQVLAASISLSTPINFRN